jgi:transglutaminase-like putative cysteine protease
MSAVLFTGLVSAPLLAAGRPAVTIRPDFMETRIVELTQTVNLRDLPPGTRQLRLWVPVPTDRAWQRVLDFEVVSAPGTWTLQPQADGRGDFLYIEVVDPRPGDAEVVVSCTVERQGVHFPIEHVYAGDTLQSAAFDSTLVPDAPLMEVSDRVQALADEACASETDIARQAMLLVQKVADAADHYSKDASKPNCGRGSSEDCLDHGGGCCTDLHSLFIAMARARGIAARMQYGYRLLDAKEGPEFDPGYRCWVEYFIPGAGWVPTDIVAADNAGAEHPYRWASLSPYRVWLWEGRSFELTPPAKAGRIDTMLCGWAEIDGRAVDPLPGADGTPSRLTRRVKYEVLEHTRPADAPKLPE